MHLHYATAVEAARSTLLGISILPVLCIVSYPASYKSLGSVIDLYYSLTDFNHESLKAYLAPTGLVSEPRGDLSRRAHRPTHARSDLAPRPIPLYT